ncbi:hypothetical protein QJS10_CPB18g01287 [Acorus calamus]|uniref:Uncharacterized protein n=1 Tax=Acorus calamus TaxID=4465 RepID=A0AAV9CR66_ACOCL|nr:hypothetical protein QJS10_CPB18g01287 [Acorus calamus]
MLTGTADKKQGATEMTILANVEMEEADEMLRSKVIEEPHASAMARQREMYQGMGPQTGQLCGSTDDRFKAVGGAPTHVPLMKVEVEWQPELIDMVRNLKQSVMVQWVGQREVTSDGILSHLRSRWKGIAFGQMWRFGRNNWIVRAPTWAAREQLLQEGNLRVEEGTIRIHECDFSTGALNLLGTQMEISLTGIPFIWRTEDIIRKVVEPFGYLVSYVEVVDGQAASPPVVATIWSNKDVLPAELQVVVGGLAVRVRVDLTDRGKRSFAQMVREGIPLAKGYGDVLGYRGHDRARPKVIPSSSFLSKRAPEGIFAAPTGASSSSPMVPDLDSDPKTQPQVAAAVTVVGGSTCVLTKRWWVRRGFLEKWF